MKVIVSSTSALTVSREQLTSGMVGKTIDVEFSSSWSGLDKMAVFTNGTIKKSVINPTSPLRIPHEVLSVPRKTVSVGFYGYVIRDGVKVIAIPTVYAELGIVELGADPNADPAAESTPAVAEQLQVDVNALDKRVTAIESAPSQPDWNQNDPTASDHIKNRIGGYLDDNNATVLIPTGYLANGNVKNGSGASSVTEGVGTNASGANSHAEGAGSQSIGVNSHAEGTGTRAVGANSHAEGAGTAANGGQSHAEGASTNASGANSHAEGGGSKAAATNSHAEGELTEATGDCSHAEGYNTKAGSSYQHVQGKYNTLDNTGTYADIIGNGSSDSKRSNAYTLDWQGNAWFAGSVSCESVIPRNGSVTLPPFISTEYNFITLYKDEASARPMWTAVDENYNMLSFNELCNRAVSLPSYTDGLFEPLQFIGSNSNQLEMFTPAKMKFDGSVFKLTTTKFILISDGTMNFQQVSGTLNTLG